MKTKALILLLLMLSLLSPFKGWGDEEQKEEKKSEEAKPKLQTRIYMQGGYESNLSAPASGDIDYQYFHNRNDWISPDLLELRLNQDAAKGALGYRLKLTAGEVPKKVHAKGLGGPDDSFDLMEAYISYIVPVGNGLKVNAGKFNTYIGAEYVEALDNACYSYSLLISYAEPTTHTGLSFSYDLSKQVNLQGYVVNGWDNFNDNNGSPSLGLALGYTPGDTVSMYLNMLNGPEQDFNTAANRLMLEWVGSFKLSKKFSILASYDWAQEQSAFPDGSNAQWNGLALTGKYEFNNRFYLALRGETFNDPQGFRTGTPQNLRELTFTTGFKVGENLFIRPEYRVDWSDVKSFNGGTSNNQSTVGIGVMLNW